MNYKELSNVFKKISKWDSKKTKVLSIKTRPFNTIAVFSNIINKTICKNKNILYIFCNREKKYASEKIKELNNFVDGIIESEKLKDNFKYIFIEEISEVTEFYDLVIFDDISLFSKVSNEYIREAVEEIYWNCNKIIIYASDHIFPIGEKLEINYMMKKYPIIEPRLMNTRIKLEENIPLSLFEYFKWFKENKRIVLIVVPSEEKLNKVYNHYCSTLKSLEIRVVRYNKNQDFKFVSDIIQGYSNTLFIITNSCGQYIRNIPNLNVIMLFADDIYYSYKKILYICGAVNISQDIQCEAIMVSREVSEEMDKAKVITRMFNKSLWEKQYLNY